MLRHVASVQVPSGKDLQRRSNDAGDYTQALDVLTKAQKLQPTWLRIMEELGYSYIQLKRFDDAAPILRQATSTYPNAELAHYYMGQVYIAKRNRNGANNEYRELRLHLRRAHSPERRSGACSDKRNFRNFLVK